MDEGYCEGCEEGEATVAWGGGGGCLVEGYSRRGRREGVGQREENVSDVGGEGGETAAVPSCKAYVEGDRLFVREMEGAEVVFVGFMD